MVAAGTTSRWTRLNAGRSAAFGVSLGLHLGLATVLTLRLPQSSDVVPDLAVTISLTAPGVALDGSAVRSEAAAEMAAVSPPPPAALPPLETGSSVPAVAGLPRLEHGASIAAFETGETPDSEQARIAASPASPEPAPSVVTPQAVMTQTPGLVPAVSEASVATATEPRTAAVKASGTASEPQTAIPLATTAAMEEPPVEAAPANPHETHASVAAAAPVAITAAVDPVALPPPARERAAGASAAAMTMTRLPPLQPAAEPEETVRLAPIEARVPGTPPSRPGADTLSSHPPSGPETAVRTADLPDGALPAQDDAEAERLRMVQTFIDRYDGGACFFMAPARHLTSDLEIDGFATDRSKFHRFDDGFRAATGSEAKVVGQWISPKQCATVDFLRNARHGSQGPTIVLDRRDLRTGDVLSGAIDGSGPEPIRLFWISENGAVEDLSDRVQDHGKRKTFAVPVRRVVEGGPYPQLLVAIIAAGSVEAVGTMTKADAFFAAIEAESVKADRSVSASGQPFRLLP